MSSILKPVLGSLPDLGHHLCPESGLWLMNEGTGTTVADLSGNGRVGTFINSPTWISGDTGSAIDFVKADTDYIKTALRIDDIAPAKEYTLIIRLKFPDAGLASGARFVLSQVGGSSDRMGLNLVGDTDSGQILKFAHYNGVSSNSVRLAIQLPDIWYDVAVVQFANDSHKIYLNGVNGTVGTTGGAPADVAADGFFMGATPTGTLPITGQISYVYIYNRALSASEIAVLYRKPFCMFERDLIELWSAAVGAAGGVTLSASVFDNITLTEDVTQHVTPIKGSVFDSIALTEDVTQHVTPIKGSVFDSIALTEDVTARITPLKASVFDSIGLTEVATARFNFFKALVFDSIGLTDVATATRITDLLEAIVFDSIGLTDTDEAHITPLKALVFDSINLLDNAAISFRTLEAIVFDTIAATDAPASEVLSFLQNIISGEIEQFPQFHGNVPAWNVEVAKYVERHLRGLRDDVEVLYSNTRRTFEGLTLSSLTEGSVIFAGTGGVLSQDNSNLFWDNVKKRLEAGNGAITSVGGYAVKLTNKTGSATVAGQLVSASTGTDDAFVTAGASSDAVIGIVLEAGIADGSEAWVVESGVADVLIDAGGCAHGDRIISSATAGSADVWNTGGAVATHFLEIGHCLETRVGAGLARVKLHFN